jgi:hypothetical protein
MTITFDLPFSIGLADVNETLKKIVKRPARTKKVKQSFTIAIEDKQNTNRLFSVSQNLREERTKLPSLINRELNIKLAAFAG